MRVYKKVMIEVPNLQKIQVKPHKFVGQSIAGIAERLNKDISPFVKEKQKFPDYDWSAFVSKISIKESDEAIKSATVVIDDPYFLFGDMFFPGLFITIEVGWNMAGGYGEMFRGMVQRVRPTFKLASSSITLECLVGEAKMAMIEESQTNTPEVDDEEANIEQKTSIKDELREICKKNNLELGDVITEHEVVSSGKNQSIKPGDKTDLQRLFELSKKYYAVWFVKKGKLYFLDLVYVWRTFKPQMAFVFRKLVSTKEISEQNVLMAGFVGRGIEVKDGATEGYQEFLIEEAEVTEGRPQKTAKTKADVEGDDGEFSPAMIQSEQIKGAPSNIDQYRFEWKKVDEFDDAHPGEGTALMAEFWRRGTIEWEKIKQFFTLVPVEDASAPDKPDSNVAQETKPKEIYFEEGLKIKMPFGNWKIRPIGVVKVLGIGRYSGSYYMGEVESEVTSSGFDQSITLLRVKDIAQGAKKEGTPDVGISSVDDFPMKDRLGRPMR